MQLCIRPKRCLPIWKFRSLLGGFGDVFEELVNRVAHADSRKFSIMIRDRTDAAQLLYWLTFHPLRARNLRTHIFQHLSQWPSSTIAVSEGQERSVT
jgi:hypothetical protein